MANWVERVVVGVGFCPFAARPVRAGAVRYVDSSATDTESVAVDLLRECRNLDANPAIETTLLVLDHTAGDFDAYLDLLHLCERLLDAWRYTGTYQLASFHPAYRFEGLDAEDAANHTNRAPWPVIQLLREASVSAAVSAHPDPASIPGRNIARARELGAARLTALACTRASP